MTAPVLTPLRERVEALAPIIKTHAAEAERERSLARPVFDALVGADLFRIFVPRAYGGQEVDVVEGFKALERISEFDSAAGWNLQISAIGGPFTVATFPEEGAAEVFSDPRAVMAGGFNPPGTATVVDGGYQVSGRWPFVSICQHATWLSGVAIVMKDGLPQTTPEGQPILMQVAFRPNDAQIIDTWNPLGMKGSGSHDIAVENLFVPEHHAGAMRPFDDLPPAFQGPLYKLGVFPVVLGTAVVALGVARAAIDQAVENTKSRIPAFMQPRPVDRGVAHMQLARAEAALSSARAYFYGTLESAWQSAVAGERPTLDQRLHLQLAACQAAEGAATAVDLIHQVVGSAGVREEQHQFARHFRDVHTINHHALASAARFESMGQVMLGLETDWAFIWL